MDTRQAPESKKPLSNELKFIFTKLYADRMVVLKQQQEQLNKIKALLVSLIDVLVKQKKVCEQLLTNYSAVEEVLSESSVPTNVACIVEFKGLSMEAVKKGKDEVDQFHQTLSTIISNIDNLNISKPALEEINLLSEKELVEWLKSSNNHAENNAQIISQALKEIKRAENFLKQINCALTTHQLRLGAVSEAVLEVLRQANKNLNAELAHPTKEIQKIESNFSPGFFTKANQASLLPTDTLVKLQTPQL